MYHFLGSLPIYLRSREYCQKERGYVATTQTLRVDKWDNSLAIRFPDAIRKAQKASVIIWNW